MTAPKLDQGAFVECIVELALDKKAEEVLTIDLRDRPAAADWFILCQGDNTVHNQAIADAIVVGLKAHGYAPWHEEGREEGRWILIDYVDVIVHVMLDEVREYYSLESLWSGDRRPHRRTSDS